MKKILILAAMICCSAVGYAQTAPSFPFVYIGGQASFAAQLNANGNTYTGTFTTAWTCSDASVTLTPDATTNIVTIAVPAADANTSIVLTATIKAPDGTSAVGTYTVPLLKRVVVYSVTIYQTYASN